MDFLTRRWAIYLNERGEKWKQNFFWNKVEISDIVEISRRSTICPVISWEVIHNSYMYKLIERLGNVQAISISLHNFFWPLITKLTTSCFIQALAEWVVYTASGIFSGLYHSCDVGTWCLLTFNVLQVWIIPALFLFFQEL